MEQWEADLAVQYARDTRWTQAEAILLAHAAIRRIHDDIRLRAIWRQQRGRQDRSTRWFQARDLETNWLLRQ